MIAPILGYPPSRQRRAVQAGYVIVEPSLAQALAPFVTPIAFLDFETVGLPIPVWNGCHPYDAVPVQFSCHVEDAREPSSRRKPRPSFAPICSATATRTRGAWSSCSAGSGSWLGDMKFHDGFAWQTPPEGFRETFKAYEAGRRARLTYANAPDSRPSMSRITATAPCWVSSRSIGRILRRSG